MSRLGGVNARDIRTLLDGGSHHPNVVHVLVSLAERQDHLFHLLEQLAHAFDTMANSQLAQANAVSILRDQHERMKQAKSMGIKVGSEAADDTPT